MPFLSPGDRFTNKAIKSKNHFPSHTGLHNGVNLSFHSHEPDIRGSARPQTCSFKVLQKESAESTDVTKGVQSVLKAKQVPHTHHITNRLLLTVKQVISIIQYIAVK